MTDQNYNYQDQQGGQETGQPMGQQPLGQQGPVEEFFSPEDIEKNKTIAGLAYLIFFLPLIAAPESRYARFHANQALVLFLAAVIGNIVLAIIPIIGWILLPIFGIGVLVLVILGLMNGLNGKAKRLPVIGQLNLIK